MHSGLSPEICNIEEVYYLIRTSNVHYDSSLADILWSKPQADHTQKGWKLSEDSLGYTFSEDVTQEFFKRGKFKMMFRGHELIDEGIAKNKSGTIITISSVVNYANDCNKKGGILTIDQNGKIKEIIISEKIPSAFKEPAILDDFSLEDYI